MRKHRRNALGRYISQAVFWTRSQKPEKQKQKWTNWPSMFPHTKTTVKRFYTMQKNVRKLYIR
jgi:hypothetical protein